jgi:hypothetical protein
MGRAAWPATIRPARCWPSMLLRGPLEPLGRPAGGFVDNARALPTTPPAPLRQKRTYDPLHKPDIFTRHRQGEGFRVKGSGHRRRVNDAL